MIIQFNPNKLCKQPFFMEIVNYLYLNQPVTLRAIKRQFPFQKNIDKLIEEFVKEGYIERFEKRYRLLISLVSDFSKIDLEQHFFINDDSTCYLELLNRRFVTEIRILLMKLSLLNKRVSREMILQFQTISIN